MRRRSGFTLVEVLVSTALIVFIMLILSQGFIAALTATRELKAVGDLQEKLRTVAIVLRNDLAADHFAMPRQHLSQQDLTQYLTPVWSPPADGFFRIWQGSAMTSPGPGPPTPQDWDEGADGDTIHSFRSIDNILHFTVRLSGPSRDNYMTAILPTGSPLGAIGSSYGPLDYQVVDTYNGQFAEVAYYLRRPTNPPSAGSTPLYALYRRQRLIL